MCERSSSLAVYSYPCTAEKPLISQTLVLLHGWGCDSSTWLPLLPGLQTITDIIAIDLPGFGNSPALDNVSLDAIIARLEPHLPAQAILVGWSFGGMLAVQLAVRFAQKIIGIITLAANVKFVASSDYPTAMPCAINDSFNKNFAVDAQAALRVFSNLLAQGDAHERTLLKKLHAHPAVDPGKSWLDALLLLAQLDNRSTFSALGQPGLHLLAEKDALVPAVAAVALRKLHPQQKVIVVEHCAHALHWSQPEKIMEQIHEFLHQFAMAEKVVNNFSGILDKQKVAQSFSRAAATYDAVANLQRAVGGELFSLLPARLAAESLVIDLGSGTGFFSAQLATHYPASNIIAVDIAEGMLRYAAQQHAGTIQWLCGDAEKIPLADNSIDVIFSSLSIQWCNELPQLMQEIARVLTPGGQFFCATLGPQTLHELKSAWRAVDNYVHVNRFPPSADVHSALMHAGFSQIKIRQENRILYFSQLLDLTRELKALGAHNINPGKAEGLTGRTRLRACKNAYEQCRTEYGLPATYDVIYVVATKPQEMP